MSALVASVIVALSAAQVDADAVKPFTPEEQRELEERARADRAKEEEQEKRLDALGCQRTELAALTTPWRWERFHWGVTAGVAGTTAGELGFAAIPEVDYVVVDLKWVCVPATPAELDAAGFAGWAIDWIAVARWTSASRWTRSSSPRLARLPVPTSASSWVRAAGRRRGTAWLSEPAWALTVGFRGQAARRAPRDAPGETPLLAKLLCSKSRPVQRFRGVGGCRQAS